MGIFEQNEKKLIDLINGYYKNGDKETVINRAEISFEAFLSSGLSVGTVAKALIDVGVRNEELAIGLIEGILKVDDSKLGKNDKMIKQACINFKGKMLLGMIEELVKK